MNLSAFFDIQNILVNIPLGITDYRMSWIEAMTISFGIMSFWYACKEKWLTFFFGFIHAILYALILYQIQSYSSLFFQLFLLITYLYGWYAWTHPTRKGRHLFIRWLNPKVETIIFISACLMIGILSVSIDSVLTLAYQGASSVLLFFNIPIHHIGSHPTPFPFFDATIYTLSIIAQLLMVRKYVENWIFFGAINIITIGLYTYQGVYILAFQYLVLLLISVKGMKLWSHKASDTKAIRANYLGKSNYVNR